MWSFILYTDLEWFPLVEKNLVLERQSGFRKRGIRHCLLGDMFVLGRSKRKKDDTDI